jgi:hypothetical protein
MTRPWGECRYKGLAEEKVKETTAAAADQRNLITKASTADMAAEVENDRRENVRKLTQAHDVSARTIYAALMRTAKLSKKSARWVNKRSSLKMTKELFRTSEAAEAMAAALLWQSETSFSLFERRPGANRELADLILAQEAS